MLPSRLVLLGSVALLGLGAARAAEPGHNVVLFVPDGLRAVMVGPETAPAMAALRDAGVDFRNSHALFPTFTTPNASTMATGHYLGDTGDFANTIYVGFPVHSWNDSVTPFLESDPVLGDVDEHFAGDYLDEVTLLEAARKAGLSTAAIGKLGPTLIMDPTERSGKLTIVVDDQTGSDKGIPLSPEMADRLAKAGLALQAPGRKENGNPGAFDKPGTTTPNIAQQAYFADVFTKIVLPLFKERGKPFVAVYWSRDPDGTQHNQGDSLGKLVPGIDGPTSLAAIRNADDNLKQIRQALAELGLDKTTDILVSADHGFATIDKESRTSEAAKAGYGDVTPGLLPPGFLAIDIAKATGMPLFDPDQANAPVGPGKHPKAANGLIGADPAHPRIVVAANGGSDLVYLPDRADKALAAAVVKALLAQDYVSGLFVDEAFGRFPGTLPLSAVGLKGSARTPTPSIAVNFRSFATGCDEPLRCTAEIADSVLQQGQGMHGGFSRAETRNFMAAIGPDFKSGYADPAPVSNADVGKTLARILNLAIPTKGHLTGRVVDEALAGGKEPKFAKQVLRSAPDGKGTETVLELQTIGTTRYFDAAGFPGRTVGLEAAK
jgi:hypothetical protein